MVYDTKAISWNESLKQLQRRYTNKQVDRKEFEDIELMEFFRDNDYISLPTHISGLSKHVLLLTLFSQLKIKIVKLAQLCEYVEDDNNNLCVEQLYFV